MIKREKTRKNPKKMAARFARRQRGGGGGGGSEALGRGVGGVVPPHPPPIGDAWLSVRAQFLNTVLTRVSKHLGIELSVKTPNKI